MVRYQKRKEHIASKIQDETVMVDIDSGNYFALNEVASSIWDLLDQPRSTDEVCSELMQEYEIDEENCRKQTEEFIKELLKLKLIESVNG